MAYLLPRSDNDRVAMLDWTRSRYADVADGFTEQAQPIGILHQGELAAVAVYDGYRGGQIELTFVSESRRALTPRAVALILAYAFLHVGVRRITTYVRVSNKEAQKLNRGLGFAPEGRMRQLFEDGEDGIIWGMTSGWFRKSRWMRYIPAEPTQKAA